MRDKIHRRGWNRGPRCFRILIFPPPVFRLRFRRTRRFTRLGLVYGRFSVFPSVIFFFLFQILPPFAEIYEQQEEEVSWGGCLAGRRPYRGGDICISEISALSAARYIELVYFGRRIRGREKDIFTRSLRDMRTNTGNISYWLAGSHSPV